MSTPRSDDVVVVTGLSKTFHHPLEQVHTLKERALRPFRVRDAKRFEALQDVSFAIERGEFFGIVGRNGSGKSTLLKCLAGIYRADAGDIEIGGRPSTFIELGVGFNLDLPARENVVLNGIMLGLTVREARARFDAIIEFAELEDFVNLKLKNYSSGMQVRLAFAVMVQVDADILLIDEVLAVGDAAFQQKCFDEFHRLKDEGKTIVFVTHDMVAVERYCDRAMLLERGRVVENGLPSQVARDYHELNFGRLPLTAASDAERLGDRRAAEIVRAWIEDASGHAVSALPQGTRCSVCFEARVHADLPKPEIVVTLRNEARHTVFVAREHTGTTFGAGAVVEVRLRFETWLAPGRYTVSPGLAHEGAGANAIDLREDLVDVIIHGTAGAGGIVDLPHEFSVSESAGRATA